MSWLGIAICVMVGLFVIGCLGVWQVPAFPFPKYRGLRNTLLRFVCLPILGIAPLLAFLPLILGGLCAYAVGVLGEEHITSIVSREYGPGLSRGPPLALGYILVGLGLLLGGGVCAAFAVVRIGGFVVDELSFALAWRLGGAPTFASVLVDRSCSSKALSRKQGTVRYLQRIRDRTALQHAMRPAIAEETGSDTMGTFWNGVITVACTAPEERDIAKIAKAIQDGGILERQNGIAALFALFPVFLKDVMPASSRIPEDLARQLPSLSDDSETRRQLARSMVEIHSAEEFDPEVRTWAEALVRMLNGVPQETILKLTAEPIRISIQRPEGRKRGPSNLKKEKSFVCSFCTQRFVADADLAGEHIECPTCCREIVFPSDSRA